MPPGFFNFAMLLLVEALLYRLARRFVTPALAFLILTLFASTSLVQLVTGSLLIEKFLAAMVVGLALALVHFASTGDRGFLYLAAILAGTALAIKFGGLAYVVAAIAVAAFEIRRHWRNLGPRPGVGLRHRPGSVVGGGLAHLRDLLASYRRSRLPIL